MPVDRSSGKKKKQKSENRKINIKEKVAEALELPKEVALNVPRLTMVGSTNLLIENYKGIIEYDDKRIRVNTGIGIIGITGKGMSIMGITSENVMINGEIHAMEFLR